MRWRYYTILTQSICCYNGSYSLLAGSTATAWSHQAPSARSWYLDLEVSLMDLCSPQEVVSLLNSNCSPGATGHLEAAAAELVVACCSCRPAAMCTSNSTVMKINSLQDIWRIGRSTSGRRVPDSEPRQVTYKSNDKSTAVCLYVV